MVDRGVTGPMIPLGGVLTGVTGEGDIDKVVGFVVGKCVRPLLGLFVGSCVTHTPKTVLSLLPNSPPDATCTPL